MSTGRVPGAEFLRGSSVRPTAGRDAGRAWLESAAAAALPPDSQTEERLESSVAAQESRVPTAKDRVIIDADCPSLAFLGDVVERDAVPG